MTERIDVHTPDRPAICILCSPLPARGEASTAIAIDSGRTSPTISWYGSLEQIESWHRSEQPPAILIDPAVAESRRNLRNFLRAGRRAVPTLRAAVIGRAGGVNQADLLVEEGIEVVLASRFSGTGRPRRPVPAGWPCRSMQWGLWELQRQTPTATSWGGKLFGRTAVPRLKPGMLAAIDTATTAGTHDAQRLKSLRARLGGQVSAGRLIMASLGELPALVSDGDSRQTPGSILRAA